MVQLVHFDESFDREALESFLAAHGLVQRGFDYHTVAVIGCQSSGKSTLLNMLFETRFPTMQSEQGRYQVTQGVWLGVARAGALLTDSPTLVLDLEGTDSRERGEEAGRFERKTALLALALAEVLVVNMWTQDIGRYNAANLALLRTVLEQDLALFHKYDKKTKLLFVFRDHVSTPLERLTDIVEQDMRQIWDCLGKPEAMGNKQLHDLFDIEYVSLPHKELDADGFAAQVSRLRARFEETPLRRQMFRAEYARGIAADGFARYCEQVWQVIRENRELDIPTQKEALSRVRCEEIAREAEALFDAEADDVAAAYARVMDEYGARSSRYLPAIAAARREQLHRTLSAQARDVFGRRLAQATDRLIGDAGKMAEARVTRMRETTEKEQEAEWDAVEERLAKVGATLRARQQTAAALPPPFADDAPWQVLAADETERFQRALQRAEAAAREQLIRIAREAARAQFERQAKAALEREWNRGEVEASARQFWERLQERVLDAARQASSAALQRCLTPLDLTAATLPTSMSTQLTAHREDTAAAMLSLLQSYCTPPSVLLMHVQRRFEEAFRYESPGQVPRVWRPGVDIRAVFTAAKDITERFLAALQCAVIDGTEHVLLSERDHKALREQLQQRMSAAYVDAVRVQDAARMRARVPPWLLVLLVVLGWNEMMMVLQRPLLLLLVLLVVPMVVIGYRLRLLHPMLENGKALALRGATITARVLHEIGAPGEWPTQPVANGGGAAHPSASLSKPHGA